MKKLLATLAVLCIAFTAQAQYSRSAPVTTVLNGGTTNIAATATNTVAVTVDVRFQSYVGLYVAGVGSGAGTGNLYFDFAKSHDGVNFETVPSLTLTMPLNGTTAVKYFSSQQVDGVHSLQLTKIRNTNDIYVTNLTFGYLIKR